MSSLLSLRITDNALRRPRLSPLTSQHLWATCVSVLQRQDRIQLQHRSPELRNRRSHVHDVISPRDRIVLITANASSRITLFVVPQSTIRFRRDIAEHGGIALDTEIYLVATDEVAELVDANGWACWPAQTPNVGIPRIAQQITETILERYPDLSPPSSPLASPVEADPSTDTTDATRDITGTVADHATAPEQRVAKAFQLCAEGITTQAQAAAHIPCSPTTLSEDFHKLNIKSPWQHGGARPGSGRPPQNQVPRSGPPPTA